MQSEIRGYLYYNPMSEVTSVKLIGFQTINLKVSDHNIEDVQWLSHKTHPLLQSNKIKTTVNHYYAYRILAGFTSL